MTLGVRMVPALLVAALSGHTAAGAQTPPVWALPLKVPVAASERGACPAAQAYPPRSAAPSAPVMDSLLTAGSRASILGDLAAAEGFFRRAAEIDPRNAVVSYRLARTLDDQGQGDAAVLEYCRYLTLSPAALDAGEIRGRVTELLGAADAAPEAWRADADAGVSAYRAGRFAEAIDAFSRVTRDRPDLAFAFYDRGVAHASAGNAAEAAADLQAYLALEPAAGDRAAVQTQLDRLRTQATGRAAAEDPEPVRVTPPGEVLIRGLVLPGLGQHTTGRTTLGMGILAAVGAALYVSTHEERVVRRMQAQDPFGNPYEYDVQSLERPYQTLGIGAAVAIGVSAALESWLYARRRVDASGAPLASTRSTTPRSQASLEVAPAGAGVRIGVRVDARR